MLHLHIKFWHQLLSVCFYTSSQTSLMFLDTLSIQPSVPCPFIGGKLLDSSLGCNNDGHNEKTRRSPLCGTQTGCPSLIHKNFLCFGILLSISLISLKSLHNCCQLEQPLREQQLQFFFHDLQVVAVSILFLMNSFKNPYLIHQ